jgi:hypothetical protein
LSRTLNAGEHEHRARSRDGDRLQFMHELVERLLAVCQTLGGYDAIEHQNGNIVPGDLTAQLGRKPIEPVGFQNT